MTETTADWVKRERERRQQEREEEQARTQSNGCAADEPLPISTLLRPYVAHPFEQIPRRRWLHAGHYQRGCVVVTVAPGGFGKTSLLIANTLEMVTGRGLLGPPPRERYRVGFLNAGEDDIDELDRRIAAACLYHKIDPHDLEGYLFLGSGLNGHHFVEMNKHGRIIFDEKMRTWLTEFVADQKIDCLILDPLKPFHLLPEGDNGAMEYLVRSGFWPIATATDSCVELSHHTRKPQFGQTEVTADDSRGGGGLVNAARSVRILNRMNKDDAGLPKIAERDRQLYLRVTRGKANYVPPTDAMWIHLASVALPNDGDGESGDNVQCAARWDYPQPFDGVTADHMREMRRQVCLNPNYRTDARSPDWVGFALARLLGLDIGKHGDKRTDEQDGNRRKVSAILAAWFANGVLSEEMRRDEKARKEFGYAAPGNWEDDAQ